MQALYAQLLVGLINGSFYALLSLGLAVIFGMLNIINFAHGAVYMMGAFCAYFLLHLTGLGYWPALIIAPIVVGIFGMILERTMLQWLAGLDHLYGLLLTFGMALIIQGVFQNYFGSSGLPYAIPDELKGGMNLGFMFLPIYRAWVVIFSLVVCFATWYLIERTRLGAYLRAATENPTLVRAFGVNVPRMITLMRAVVAMAWVFGTQAFYLIPSCCTTGFFGYGCSWIRVAFLSEDAPDWQFGSRFAFEVGLQEVLEPPRVHADRHVLSAQKDQSPGRVRTETLLAVRYASI